MLFRTPVLHKAGVQHSAVEAAMRIAACLMKKCISPHLPSQTFNWSPMSMCFLETENDAGCSRLGLINWGRRYSSIPQSKIELFEIVYAQNVKEEILRNF